MKKGVIILIVFLVLVLGLLAFLKHNTPSYDIQDNEKQTEEVNGQLEGSSDEIDTNYSAIEKTEKRVYDKRIEKAFEDVDCPVSNRNLSRIFYTGKLIDTHIHMPSIPEDLDSDSYDTSRSVLGENIHIKNYICMMDYERTEKVLAFFPIWEPIISESVEIVNRTMVEYPGRFIPFIMPPDSDGDEDGYPTVDAVTLDKMLNIQPGLFRGYGEIGLYARGDHGGPKGAPALPPDSERLREIYPIIRKHNLTVYFHLGEGQKESFEKVLEENRDINFIWHGDQLIGYGNNGKQDLSKLDDILSKHPNAYYGVDELYGDEWLLRPEVGKANFLAHFGNYKPLIEEDLATWKAFIEEHSDQVLWGTDRGGLMTWGLDLDVAETLNNYSRYFIAHLETEVQEKFAYKNAEKLFS